MSIIREQIMDLIDPLEYHPADGIVEQCADLAEAREAELLAEIESWKLKYMNHDLMAACMDSTTEDLRRAGIFGKEVPPMFVTDAVLGYIGKIKAEHALMVAEWNRTL